MRIIINTMCITINWPDISGDEGFDINNTHLSTMNPDYNANNFRYYRSAYLKQIKAWIEKNRSLCCHVTT